MLRTRRIGLQLLPQVPHINAQIVAVLHRIRPPDLIEQLPLGQHLAGIIEQYRQQAKFNRRQVDLLLAAYDAAGGDINVNIGKTHPRFVGLGAGMAAHRHPQPRLQLANTKGFTEIVIGTGVKRGDFVLLLGARRQHDNRHLAPLANLANKRVAVTIG